MTAAVKTKPDPVGAFMEAYGRAGAATSDLRAAYGEVDAAERAVRLAVVQEREAARVALVAGTTYVAAGGVPDAQQALQAAREQLTEHKGADEVRQSALQLAMRDLVDGGGKDALATAIEQLVDAGQNRIEHAVDELAAARRQMALAIGMLGLLDGARATGGLREAASLTRVAGLQSRNGEPYGWHDVEAALRAMGPAARGMLRSFVERPAAPKAPRVSTEEMLTWHIAAGGSFSDAVGEIRQGYLERGPRRDEAFKDSQEQDTGRTGDQRSWSTAA